jgi:hypothetical protein
LFILFAFSSSGCIPRCPRMMPMKMLLPLLMGGKKETLSPSTFYRHLASFTVVFLRDV